LTGVRALPRRTLAAGFSFRHRKLEEPLRDLFGRPA
jgi:NAD dependent epimerase/dehydratase family enzyme